MQLAQNIETVIAYYTNAVKNETVTGPIDEFDETTERDFEYVVNAPKSKNIAQHNLNYFVKLRGKTELTKRENNLLQYALEIAQGE